MSNIDIEYHELCRTILREGYEYVDESRGIVCKQISSYTIEVDKVFTQFPLITTKKMFTKGIVGELIWFLRGDSNIKYLNENKITIWNKDAYNWHKKLYPGTLMQQQNFGKQVLSFDDNLLLGDVGRNYGVQWRDWTIYNKDLGGLESEVTGVDQIANLIHNLIVKPMSRRHIVTAWNPAELDQTALPPCHWAFEVIPYPIGLPVSIALASQYEDLSNIPLDEEGIDYIRRKLEEYNVPQYMFDLKWHQRSCDVFLGVPFNITSYALLMRIIAELTNMIPNKLIGDLSNVHFYQPHIELVEKQLINNPFVYAPVDFEFSDNAKHYFEAFRNSTLSDNGSNLDFVLSKLEIKDFIFNNYESYDKIEAEMYEPKK